MEQPLDFGIEYPHVTIARQEYVVRISSKAMRQIQGIDSIYPPPPILTEESSKEDRAKNAELNQTRILAMVAYALGNFDSNGWWKPAGLTVDQLEDQVPPDQLAALSVAVTRAMNLVQEAVMKAQAPPPTPMEPTAPKPN